MGSLQPGRDTSNGWLWLSLCVRRRHFLDKSLRVLGSRAVGTHAPHSFS